METALVLPVALLFLFGIMEYGRFVMTQQVLTNAVREGCRYAVTHITPVSLGGVTYGAATSNVTTTISNISPGVQLSGQIDDGLCVGQLGKQPGHLDQRGRGAMHLRPDHRQLHSTVEQISVHAGDHSAQIPIGHARSKEVSTARGTRRVPRLISRGKCQSKGEP